MNRFDFLNASLFFFAYSLILYSITVQYCNMALFGGKHLFIREFSDLVQLGSQISLVRSFSKLAFETWYNLVRLTLSLNERVRTVRTLPLHASARWSLMILPALFCSVRVAKTFCLKGDKKYYPI